MSAKRTFFLSDAFFALLGSLVICYFFYFVIWGVFTVGDPRGTIFLPLLGFVWSSILMAIFQGSYRQGQTGAIIRNGVKVLIILLINGSVITFMDISDTHLSVNLTVSPQSTQPGEQVQITCTFVNRSHTSQTYSYQILDNGRVLNELNDEVIRANYGHMDIYVVVPDARTSRHEITLVMTLPESERPITRTVTIYVTPLPTPTPVILRAP